MPPRPGSSFAIVNTEVSSNALAERISELLAASEQAAHAIRDRAKLDAGALRRAAGEDDLMRSRERLPQLEASVSRLTELVKELRAEVHELGTELMPDGEGRPSSPPDPATFPPQVDRRALLILLNMASNGATRSETADYLAQNLGLHDCDELLSAVYGYVDSVRRS